MTYFVYQRKNYISYWSTGKQKSSKLQLIDICTTQEEVLSRHEANEFVEINFEQLYLTFPVEKPNDPLSLYEWNRHHGCIQSYIYGKVIFNHKDKQVPLYEIKK